MKKDPNPLFLIIAGGILLLTLYVSVQLGMIFHKMDDLDASIRQKDNKITCVPCNDQTCCHKGTSEDYVPLE